MKTRITTGSSNRIFGSCAALFGSIVMAANPAMADDTAKFDAADADISGTLSLTEFKTTLSKNAPQKQVDKKFARADADSDGSVTLEEWLAYRSDIEEEVDDRAKFTALFNEADQDDDDLLSYEEFTPTVRGKRPLIEVRKRFLRADTDGDFLVSLDEWLAMKGDDMDEPVKRTKFELADLDGDDQLTLDEFTTTFPRKTPAKTVSKKFNREDTNDDGFLTRDEWNPGGKNTADPV